MGYTAANAVADNLAGLLRKRPDPAAQVRLGRFVMPDGSLSRRGAGAVAVWLTDPGSTSLSPGSGTIVGVGGVTGFGSRAVDASGRLMDFDGVDVPSGGITARGMQSFACDGSVVRRYY